MTRAAAAEARGPAAAAGEPRAAPARLRVLLVIHSPQRRGAEVSALDVAGALGDLGHATRLVALYRSRGAHPLPLRPGDATLAGDPRHPAEHLPGLHPSLLARLRREIRRFAPDVVQVNGSRTVKYGAAAAATAARRRWALVYRNIGDPQAWQRAGWRRAVYGRLVMRRMDGLVGGSARNLERVAATYGLTVPAEVIPRGVDPRRLAPRRSRAEVRRELGTEDERPVLLYLGSLTPEKRVDRLLDVAARLPAAAGPAALWLAGDGPLRGELAARVEAAGLGGRVRFLGVRDDVGDLIAAADVLVLASDTEGTPGAILEAAALGVPAVATRVGGVPELVADGETGLLVAPADVEGFTAAVVALVADPERRRAMGERAKLRVEDGFLLPRLATRYETFYRRVLAARAGRDGGG